MATSIITTPLEGSTLPSSTCYESVVRMREVDIAEVEDTLAAWKRETVTVEAIDSDKKTKAVMSDFLFVLDNINSHIKDVKSFYVTLLAKDCDKRIQAIACYQLYKPLGGEEALYVKELLVAPWNVRCPNPVIFSTPSLHGGGILLIDAMFRTAQHLGLKMLHLSSTATACGFYQKLGMRLIGVNHFEFHITRLEDNEKMGQAFAKTFGKSFHYSLLM